MRADRLISILLMLQDRGRVTAGEVADELEISVRTARRDLEALAQAGLPVFSLPGRGGGWELLGDGRTDLTGLSTPEASALFTLLVNSRPVTEGMARETGSAIQKLAGALPRSVRETAERAAASTRIVDRRWQANKAERPPTRAHEATETTVDQVRAGILSERRAELVYRDRARAVSTRLVDPLGVVHKNDKWYLVAQTETGQRTFRLDRIERFTLTDEPAQRPADFDLDAAWQNVETAVADLRRTARAEVAIDSNAIRRVQFVLGDRLTLGEPGDDHTVKAASDAAGDAAIDSTITATVGGGSVAELAAVLAGLHPWVRVIAPPALQRELARIGDGLVAEYGPVVDEVG